MNADQREESVHESHKFISILCCQVPPLKNKFSSSSSSSSCCSCSLDLQVQERMLATTNLTSTYQARTVCKQNERDTVVAWLTLFRISWV